MVTNRDVFEAFPGAKVADPKDVDRNLNRPERAKNLQEREASAAKAEADRKTRIAQALKAGVRRQQAQQGRLFG